MTKKPDVKAVEIQLQDASKTETDAAVRRAIFAINVTAQGMCASGVARDEAEAIHLLFRGLAFGLAQVNAAAAADAFDAQAVTIRHNWEIAIADEKELSERNRATWQRLFESMYAAGERQAAGSPATN